RRVLFRSLQSSFDLSGPLFKIGHFRLADGDRILLIIHHLLVDGVSWRILLEDLSNLYGQIYQGLKVSLPLKTDSFQRWSLLLSEYSKGKDQESERSYWSSLEDVSIALFPKDIITSRGSVLNIDSGVSFTLDSFLTGILQSDVHQVYNTEIRSEEHTSELQSRENLVCRLLLDKKKEDGFARRCPGINC